MTKLKVVPVLLFLGVFLFLFFAQINVLKAYPQPLAHFPFNASSEDQTCD